MSFQRNAQTPHFSYEEIQQIYAGTKVKETTNLQSTARAMFPGRDPVAYENLTIGKGPGRSFKHRSDEYEKPVHIITAYPIMIGVMKDGTMYLF